MGSLVEGIRRYAQTWHRLDFLYRKLVYHTHKSGQISFLENMVNQVENRYTNHFLVQVNNRWQEWVDACESWQAPPITSQHSFYERWVAPFLENKKKIYVIISDAFRFEVANELLGLVCREDRFEAELTPMLGMLPSYTQLGMAALLPNHTLEIADSETGTALVDGLTSQGTPNRDRILKQAIGPAAAIRAEELLSMNWDTIREMLRDNEVVYIFHNRIDFIGDKKDSEERVFEAVEETLEVLMTIIKKLTAANATNLLVTADHGFIYQN